MPKYVIEREIPGAGSLTAEDLREITRRSCCVLEELGPADPVGRELRDRRPDLLRLHRLGTRICIREHARRTGFPANRVSEVRAVIGPTVIRAPGASANEAEETGAD